MALDKTVDNLDKADERNRPEKILYLNQRTQISHTDTSKGGNNNNEISLHLFIMNEILIKYLN